LRVPRRRLPVLAALLALAVAAPAHRARAEGLSGQVELSPSAVTIRSTDQSGATSVTESTALVQRYRGSLERSLFPAMQLSLNGLYEWLLGWSRTDGLANDGDARRWSIGARLVLGNPVLGGGISYDRQQNSNEQKLSGETLRSPTLVREILGAQASWRPADLPSLDLRYGRTHNYDLGRRSTDILLDEVLFGASYQPEKAWDFRYSGRFADTANRLHGVDTTDLTQSARAAWTDTFLERRATAYVSYSAGMLSTRTTATKSGGVVLTQRLPASGLSAVETFPSLPGQVKLTPNPALIDGNNTASAGLNLGFSASAAGDLNYRDMGVSFPDVLSRVNTIYVWVDQPLADVVASAFAWTVWQSKDNENWTEVGLAGPVAFSPFQNRFEIPIQTVQVRYLKATTRPLPLAVTTEPRFANIFVTEIELFEATAASEVAARGAVTQFTGQLNGTGRFVLLTDPNLVLDSSVFFTHASNPFKKSWTVVNGLSISKRLSRILLGSSRVERSDSDAGAGHEGTLRWSASLAAEPLRTLSAGFTYSGQLGQLATGTISSHSATLFGRADVYRGVSLLVTAGANLGTSDAGRETRGVSLTAGTTVTPHRSLTMTGNCSLTNSHTSGAGQPDQSDSRRSLDGTLSFSPFPALYLAASGSRISGQTPSTLTTFTLGFSPFPGGDLLMRFTYSETRSTGSAGVSLWTRLWGPGLRWNIRSGMFADVSYTVTDTTTPALETNVRALFGTLNLLLR